MLAACTPVSLNGSLVVQSGSPCGPCGGANVTTLTLSLGCGTGLYQSVVNTGIPISFHSPNEFIDVPLLEQLSVISLFYAQANAALVWRINAAPAVLLGSGGTFPTLFVGGEVVDLTVDGTPISATFEASDQSAAECAARINAAASLLGLLPPASVDAVSGQIVITGRLTGPESTVEVTPSATATQLGLSGSATGQGEDVPISGTAIMEFGQPTPVTRIQVKGVAAGVTLWAGGTPA